MGEDCRWTEVTVNGLWGLELAFQDEDSRGHKLQTQEGVVCQEEAPLGGRARRQGDVAEGTGSWVVPKTPNQPQFRSTLA